MVDIAAKLAADFLSAQGWACILIAPDAAVVVTVGGVDARDEPGLRIWMSRTQADKVMAAFLSRCQQARRRSRGAGLIVNADGATVEQMIHGIASNAGYSVSDDAVLDEQLELVTKRIETQLDRMKRTGGLRLLNGEYANARAAAKAAGSTCPASYSIWLVERLRPGIQAGLG
jgi:hypothetical protein